MIATVKYDFGQGDPLLYVPGIDGTGELLLGTAERLERRYRLVRFAYEAEDAAEADSYDVLARNIAEHMEAMGLERATVLAESFGGAVALQLALDYPDRVEGLAIVNSFAYYSRRLKLGLSSFAIQLIPDRLFRSCRTSVGPMTLLRPRKNSQVVQEFCQLSGVTFDVGYRRRMRMIQELDLRPRLSEIRQPVALFAADQDRVVDSVPAAREMAGLLPNAELEIIPRAGHLVLPLPEEPWEDRIESLMRRG